MSPIGRYVALIGFFLISLHFILSFTHQEYGRATSISNIKNKFTSTPHEYVPDKYYVPSDFNASKPLHVRKANATMVMLARNSDMDNAVQSVRRIQDRFNTKFKYPWVFLNEEPFTDEFKSRVTNVIDGEVEFGLIPHDDWFQPDWIDEEKAAAGRKKLENVIYGTSVSYRNMCRYNSRTFYKHELMQKYKWYWRVEPDVHFHCNIDFDPFLYMEDNNKVYGFTITMYEYRATIETLWQTTKDFLKSHPEYLTEGNAMGFISDNGGEEYNLCHFWSNFEIASMDFWRAPAYTAYVDYLEASGGFYYERWGDAPVHSIGAALFAHKDQIHFFDEIGYEHAPYQHCPREKKSWENGRCGCNPSRSFDYDGYSCLKKWDAFVGYQHQQW